MAVACFRTQGKWREILICLQILNCVQYEGKMKGCTNTHILRKHACKHMHRYITDTHLHAEINTWHTCVPGTCTCTQPPGIPTLNMHSQIKTLIEICICLCCMFAATSDRDSALCTSKDSVLCASDSISNLLHENKHPVTLSQF